MCWFQKMQCSHFISLWWKFLLFLKHSVNSFRLNVMASRNWNKTKGKFGNCAPQWKHTQLVWVSHTAVTEKTTIRNRPDSWLELADSTGRMPVAFLRVRSSDDNKSLHQNQLWKGTVEVFVFWQQIFQWRKRDVMDGGQVFQANGNVTTLRFFLYFPVWKPTTKCWTKSLTDATTFVLFFQHFWQHGTKFWPGKFVFKKRRPETVLTPNNNGAFLIRIRNQTVFVTALFLLIFWKAYDVSFNQQCSRGVGGGGVRLSITRKVHRIQSVGLANGLIRPLWPGIISMKFLHLTLAR